MSQADDSNTREFTRPFTVTQAAERLGVGSSTLYKLIAAGEIAHTRIGPRLIRIDAEDLADFQRRHRTGVREVTPASVAAPMPVEAGRRQAQLLARLERCRQVWAGLR